MAIDNVGISVIICCYNSSERLPETLKYIAGQEVHENFPWEVIVVDNASVDATYETALRECSQYTELAGRFQIIDELKPGLSYARQRGAEVAQYNYIVFCDDDNWLASTYLENAVKIMEGDPKIGALGGRSTAVTDGIQFPEWFDAVKNGYAVGPQSKYQGDISKICMLWGAGMVTSRNLFINCFSPMYSSILTDRTGNSLSSGGDTEYCLRLLLKGYKLYYDEKLTFAHFISKERLTKDYKSRLTHESSPGHFELRRYYLLYLTQITKPVNKPFLVIKTVLGFLSSKILNRKSWSYQDVKNIIFFTTKIDFGVDATTLFVYSFYKNCQVS